MKPGKSFLLVTFFSLFSISTPSQAGMYASGGLSLNDHGFEVDGDAAGYTLAVGYRPKQGGFGGEIKYLDTGSAAVSGLGTLKMSGANISGVYWIRNNDGRAAGMSAYVKLGLYNINASVGPASASSQGYSAGMGFEFKVNRNMGIFTDLDGFALVDATNNRRDMMTVWSIGVRYHF